jgi:outer membrane lipoprotein-sorting protein
MFAVRGVVLALTLLASTFACATAAPADADMLVHRMAAVNPALQSYTAALHVAITMRSMPFLNPALDGNYYYRRPDKQAVVFASVPLLAEQFKKIYPKIDPPGSWEERYVVSVLDSSNGTTTLRLVPKHQGRVAHLDVQVDDATAMPARFTWTYVDGGSVTYEQQYQLVAGSYVIKAQHGHVDLPSYNADVVSTFSNFQLNVPIPDSVFEG